MIVELTQDCDGPHPDNPLLTIAKPAGTRIDHPDGHYLVRAGLAKPVDEEATARHAQFVARREKVKAARLARKQAESRARLDAFEAQLRGADAACAEGFEDDDDGGD